MIFGLFKKKEERATLATPTTWLFNSLTDGVTSSGISVNQTSALKYSALYSCVRLLSESVASLPLHTYQRTENGKERLREHPISRMMAASPNKQMSSYSFRETMMGHALTFGNGFAEIVRDASGMAIELLPITPDRVRVDVDSEGTIRYIVDEQITLDRDSVFHLAGLGFDGVIGYSPVKLAANCIGLGLAAEQFGASFFSNGARLGGILQHPAKLSQEAADRLKDSWNNTYSGSSRTGKTALLEEGMSFTTLGIPPDDAQFLQTREFQVKEIARWYGIPPHLIGAMEAATFSNIEHQQIEYVTHTLRPWLVRWEQELQRKIYMDDNIFPQFVVDGLLRGDTKTRYESYKVARESGWMSVNEIRALEDMPAIDGGDQFIQPLNMGTVGETEEIDARSLLIPLLEDALFRAKRLQENAERNALKRKGDYYGEWRNAWRANDLPPLIAEIITPAIEAIAPKEADYDSLAMMTAEKWIETDDTVEVFAQKVLGGIDEE